jgi:hypothetical protein
MLLPQGSQLLSLIDWRRFHSINGRRRGLPLAFANCPAGTQTGNRKQGNNHDQNSAHQVLLSSARNQVIEGNAYSNTDELHRRIVQKKHSSRRFALTELFHDN